MWGFGMMFWLVPLLLFLLVRRSWCWAPAGVRGHYGRGPQRQQHRGPESPNVTGLDAELEQQRGYIEQLERQVADLEERLDFTERLLAGRGPAAQ